MQVKREFYLGFVVALNSLKRNYKPVIAYCDRKPLSLEEFKQSVYDTGVKVSVDSFGGDEEAYRRFLESEGAKGFVQVE